MHVHGPSEVIDAAKIQGSLNTHGERPFYVMEVGPVTFYLYTPDEADALITAATEAKRALLAGDPPPAPAAGGSQGPCREKNPDGGRRCLAIGAHRRHRDGNGDTWTSVAVIA